MQAQAQCRGAGRAAVSLGLRGLLPDRPGAPGARAAGARGAGDPDDRAPMTSRLSVLLEQRDGGVPLGRPGGPCVLHEGDQAGDVGATTRQRRTGAIGTVSASAARAGGTTRQERALSSRIPTKDSMMSMMS